MKPAGKNIFTTAKGILPDYRQRDGMRKHWKIKQKKQIIRRKKRDIGPRASKTILKGANKRKRRGNCGWATRGKKNSLSGRKDRLGC